MKEAQMLGEERGGSGHRGVQRQQDLHAHLALLLTGDGYGPP